MENRLIIDNIVLMPDMGRGGPSRKGQQTASGGRHTMVTRPRDAASLILLRGADGVNHGITDVMSPWSAAAAAPERGFP